VGDALGRQAGRVRQDAARVHVQRERETTTVEGRAGVCVCVCLCGGLENLAIAVRRPPHAQVRPCAHLTVLLLPPSCCCVVSSMAASLLSRCCSSGTPRCCWIAAFRPATVAASSICVVAMAWHGVAWVGGTHRGCGEHSVHCQLGRGRVLPTGVHCIAADAAAAQSSTPHRQHTAVPPESSPGHPWSAA
jgi:hypothetical protein